MVIDNYRKALDDVPYYKPAKSINDIKKEMGLDNIIRLAANENTMGCSPLVHKAVRDYVNNIFLYPDGSCEELRIKLSNYYNIKPDQLVIGSGSFELLTLTAQIFLNSGDESLIPEPSFGWYKTITLAMGGRVVSVPLKNHTIDLDGIKDRLSNKSKIIWLCNPNNPTGTIILKKQLEDFLKELPANVITVMDEAYFEYADHTDYPDTVKLLDSFPNLIILRTFSKVYGLASLRVGYGIAHPDIIELFNRVRLPLNVNGIAQTAALAGLEDQEFKKRVLDNNRKGKEFFSRFFEGLNLSYIPSQTNFIMVNIKKDSIAVAEKILQQGISIRPGVEFGMPTWLRISIGRPEENEQLAERLKELISE